MTVGQASIGQMIDRWRFRMGT